MFPWRIVTRLYRSKRNVIDAVILATPKAISKTASIMECGAHILIRCREDDIYNVAGQMHYHDLSLKDIVLVLGDNNEYWLFGQKKIDIGKLTENIAESGIGCVNVKNIAPDKHATNVLFMHSKSCEYDHSQKLWRCSGDCKVKIVEDQMQNDDSPVEPFFSFRDISDLLMFFIMAIAPDGVKVGVVGFSPQTMVSLYDNIRAYYSPDSLNTGNMFVDMEIGDEDV